jgi:hypothetical protein
VLFRNDGKGGFESSVLDRAPHPAFGSSGFSVVDLDGDGDLDFLWTHGDMMDEIPLPKPYHGLRWLENQGGELVSRELLRMPGCYRALAHDLDGDGDLDIVFANGQGYSSLGALLKPRIYVNDGTGVFADETDVRAAGDAVRGVVIPDDMNIVAEYPIAVTAEAPDPDGARAFVDFVLSPAGQNILAAHGFTSP